MRNEDRRMVVIILHLHQTVQEAGEVQVFNLKQEPISVLYVIIAPYRQDLNVKTSIVSWAAMFPINSTSIVIVLNCNFCSN